MPRNLADAIIRQQRQVLSTAQLKAFQRGTLVLGGTSGSGGGSGGPPGGVRGRLIQGLVCYDTTEAALSSGSASLVDNLNHIRYDIEQLEITGYIINSSGSSTDNAITRFDDTSGSIVQNSAVAIDDSGNIATAGTVDGTDISSLVTALFYTRQASADLSNEIVVRVVDDTTLDNVFVGNASGTIITSGSRNVFIGQDAGEYVLGGIYNVGVGHSALADLYGGSYNTAIGTRAGDQVNGGDGNVFLGYMAGHGAVGVDNKLYIANSDTATPLIYGEFDNNFVKINGTFTSKKVVVSKTANYTATTNDEVILCNAAGGAFAITLPTAVGNSGLHLTIKKTDATANTVTIATVSAQTIDGTVTKVISNQYDAVKIVSDNANWSII